MNANFNISKLEFYMALREDPIIQELDSEYFIRDVTEKIITYNKQANIANRIYGNDDEYEELHLNFDDVKNISYTLGLSDNSSTIKRILKSIFYPASPLLKKVYLYERSYLDFLTTGEIDDEYIEDDMLYHFPVLLNKNIGRNIKTYSIRKAYDKSAEYIERMYTNFRLHRSSKNLHILYSDFFFGIPSDPAFSETLGYRDIKTIAFNLMLQSFINANQFRTTYLAALIADEFEDADKRVDSLFNDFTDRIISGKPYLCFREIAKLEKNTHNPMHLS